MKALQPGDRRAPSTSRALSALAATLSVFLLGLALIYGLDLPFAPASDDAMQMFQFLPPAPAVPSHPERSRSAPHAGLAAPPARKADPAPLSAPKPVVEPPFPSHIAAPPIPGTGSASAAGAASEDGSGTGAGGGGTGLGSGGAGDGTGGGVAVASQRIAGSIDDRDYPAEASRSDAQGTVIAEYTVGTDGRAHDCRVARSSANASLDAATCRLIEKRFRFLPARDAAGHPVADRRGWKQRWWFAG